MGFFDVSDYVGGKADWLAAGLLTKGKDSNTARIGTIARQDVPTSRLTDRILERTNADFCVVLNEHGVVMGLIDEAATRRSGSIVGDIMTVGPSTFRPDVPLEEMREYMGKRDMDHALVTTPDGVYVGVVYLRDIVSAIEETRRGQD